jgi:hypothetical protein
MIVCVSRVRFPHNHLRYTEILELSIPDVRTVAMIEKFTTILDKKVCIGLSISSSEDSSTEGGNLPNCALGVNGNEGTNSAASTLH